MRSLNVISIDLKVILDVSAKCQEPILIDCKPYQMWQEVTTNTSILAISSFRHYCKYRPYSIHRSRISLLIWWYWDQLSIIYLIFLCYEGEGGRILNGIKHFSIDNLSIFTPNEFTLKKEIFLSFSLIFLPFIKNISNCRILPKIQI